MLYVTISTEGIDSLADDIREFGLRVQDVMPLALDIAGVVATQNMAARMAGLDKDGYPFAELAEATWKRHPNRGLGPPLAGMEMSSRVIADFDVRVDDMGTGSADVVGTWPTMEPFLIYHVTGTVHMPRRDPAGITPSGWAEVADAFDRWLSALSER